MVIGSGAAQMGTEKDTYMNNCNSRLSLVRSLVYDRRYSEAWVIIREEFEEEYLSNHYAFSDPVYLQAFCDEPFCEYVAERECVGLLIKYTSVSNRGDGIHVGLGSGDGLASWALDLHPHGDGVGMGDGAGNGDGEGQLDEFLWETFCGYRP